MFFLSIFYIKVASTPTHSCVPCACLRYQVQNSTARNWMFLESLCPLYIKIALTLPNGSVCRTYLQHQIQNTNSMICMLLESLCPLYIKWLICLGMVLFAAPACYIRFKYPSMNAMFLRFKRPILCAHVSLAQRPSQETYVSLARKISQYPTLSCPRFIKTTMLSWNVSVTYPANLLQKQKPAFGSLFVSKTHLTSYVSLARQATQYSTLLCPRFNSNHNASNGCFLSHSQQIYFKIRFLCLDVSFRRRITQYHILSCVESSESRAYVILPVFCPSKQPSL